MARYFAFNSLAGCERTSTSVIDGYTTGTRYDANYVSSAISLPIVGTGNIVISGPFIDGSTSLSTLWLRFDWFAQNGMGTSNPIAVWLNGGVNAYRFVYTSSLNRIQYWNGTTWVDWFTLTASTPINVLTTIVIKIEANVSGEVFFNGTSVGASSGPPATAAATALTEIQLHGTNSSGPFVFSQIMGADYDIRDAHILEVPITGNSVTHTSGTGAYTDVNEAVLNDGTAIVLDTLGQKKGQTHSAITVPSGLGIAGLVVNARGRVSGGVVSDGKLGVRSGTTDSSSTSRTYSSGYEPRGAIFTIDPSTSGTWSQASFNAAETYVEAA